MICNRGSLLDLLGLVAGVMKARTPKPILECVRLHASGKTLSLSGTNMAAWVVSRTAEVEISTPFDTAVRCERFLEVIRSMSDATIAMSVVGTQLEIRGRNGTFKLPAHDPSEFPPTPDAVVTAKVEIAAPTFARLVRQSSVAVAKETQKYAISGVYIVVKSGRVEFGATEGHMVALSTNACDTKAKAFTALVPQDALDLAEKSAGEDDMLTLGVTESQVVIDAGDTRIIATQIEGQFPPYNDIIPKGSDKTARIARVEILEAIKQAATIASGDGGRNCLKLTFGRAGLNAYARSTEGEADIDLPCKYDGEGLVIGLNAKWLASGMAAMESDELKIEMTVENRPVLISDGSDYSLTMLPMNVNE